MAKIDEIKEILNTPRLFFSIGIGLMVVITGALIAKQQSDKIDLYFWIGTFLDALILIGLVKIVNLIKKHTKEIGEL